MPIQRINPVVDGLAAAVSLADRLKSMQLQQRTLEENTAARQRDDARLQEDLDLRRQTHADSQARLGKLDARQAQEDVFTDLARRLQLARDPGLAAIGQGETERPFEFQGMTDRERFAGLPDQVDVPVDQAIEFGGQRYAVRGQEETAQRELARRLSEAKALNEARDPLVNVPGYGQVRQSVVDDIIRADSAFEREQLRQDEQTRRAGLKKTGGGGAKPKPAKPAGESGQMKLDRAALAKLETEEQQLAQRVAKFHQEKLDNESDVESLPMQQARKRLAEVRARKNEIVTRLKQPAGAAPGGGAGGLDVDRIRARAMGK